MIVYALYDTVSKEFAPVFEQNTQAAAIRALKSSPEILAKIDDLTIVCIAHLNSGMVQLDASVDGYSSDYEEFIPLREFLGLDKDGKDE